MPHRYEQRSGRWTLPEGTFIEAGYSGLDDGDGVLQAGEGKNDPGAERQKNVGPIPAGGYYIGEAFTHPTAGPVAMRLEPMPGTETFGRGGFLVHGDSKERPGTASHGCIVLSRAARMAIAGNPDRQLLVVADAAEGKAQA